MEGKYIRWLKVPPDYNLASYISRDFVDEITEWTPDHICSDRFMSMHHELEQITPNIYKCHDGFFRIYDTKEQALDPPYDFKVGDKIKLVPELYEIYENHQIFPISPNNVYTVYQNGTYSWGVGVQKCTCNETWEVGWIPQECFVKVEEKPFETDFNVGDTVKVVDRLQRYPSHPKATEYGCDKYAGRKEFPETLTIKKLLYINGITPGVIITDGEWDWLIKIEGIAKVDPPTESYRIKPEPESKIYPMSDGVMPEAGMWIYNFANSSIYRLTGERDEEGYWKYDESVQVAKGSYAAIEENDSFWRKATNAEVANFVHKNKLWRHLVGQLGFLKGLYVSFEKHTFGVQPGSYLINKVDDVRFYFGRSNFASYSFDCGLNDAELSFSEHPVKIEEPIKEESVMESKLPDWVFPGVIFWEKNNHNAIRTVISVKGNLFHSTTFFYPDEYLSGDAIWDINSINSFGYEPMPYDLAQQRWIETRGIKVGDTVKVVRACNTRFLGWGNSWASGMEIGKTQKINSIISCDVCLSDGCGYPYFCLEKVESATVNVESSTQSLKIIDYGTKGEITFVKSDFDIPPTRQPKLQDLFAVTPDSVEFKLNIVKEKIINL